MMEFLFFAIVFALLSLLRLPEAVDKNYCGFRRPRIIIDTEKIPSGVRNRPKRRRPKIKIVGQGMVLLILFLFSCQSVPRQDDILGEPVTPEPTEVGCSAIRDASRWADCMTRLLKEFEDVKNAVPVVTIAEEDRVDPDYVVQRVTVCKDTVCAEFHRRQYQPTLWSRIKENSIIAVLGAALGALGVALSHGAAFFPFFL